MSRQVQTMWVIGAVIAAVLVGGCQAVAPAVDEGGPLTASGTIRANEVRVASELGGRILEVRAESGARVEAGDALVVLDATPLLTQLSQAEAAVAAAQAELAVV